MEYIVRLNF